MELINNTAISIRCYERQTYGEFSLQCSQKGNSYVGLTLGREGEGCGDIRLSAR